MGSGMYESISSPFIRYPIGTSLLMAGLLFVGLVAYPLLPVAPLLRSTSRPSRSPPACRGPETMAASVAKALAPAVNSGRQMARRLVG
jgi:HAE1 family hydrophobic/amphiphilic exporter-1